MPDGPAAPPAAPALERRPAADPLANLPRFARAAFRLIDWCQQGAPFRLLALWQRLVLEPLLRLLFFSRRLRVHGLERLQGVPSGAPLLVLANHRTFFDLFVIGCVLQSRPGTRRQVVFPVRANFFYEHPFGVAINLLLSGGAMFPPFFRSKQRRDFNAWALQLLLSRLRTPGNMVGFHPEGTRSKEPDPYALLPAQPGAGELALRGRPGVTVLPVFILGLSNRLFAELWDNLCGRRPIHLVFGAPADLSAWPAETRLSHHKRCADALLAQIAALGEEERALRAAAGGPPLGPQRDAAAAAPAPETAPAPRPPAD